MRPNRNGCVISICSSNLENHTKYEVFSFVEAIDTNTIFFSQLQNVIPPSASLSYNLNFDFQDRFKKIVDKLSGTNPLYLYLVDSIQLIHETHLFANIDRKKHHRDAITMGSKVSLKSKDKHQ